MNLSLVSPEKLYKFTAMVGITTVFIAIAYYSTAVNKLENRLHRSSSEAGLLIGQLKKQQSMINALYAKLSDFEAAYDVLEDEIVAIEDHECPVPVQTTKTASTKKTSNTSKPTNAIVNNKANYASVISSLTPSNDDNNKKSNNKAVSDADDQTTNKSNNGKEKSYWSRFWLGEQLDILKKNLGSLGE